MRRIFLNAVLGLMAALTICGCSQRMFTFVQMSDPQIGFRDKSTGYVYTDSLFAEAVDDVNFLGNQGRKTSSQSKDFTLAYMNNDDKVINIKFSKPAFVIITGDLVNDQKDALQDSIYRANREKIKVPVYEIPGNHDIRPWTPENHSNYLALRGYDRFSFRYGGCAFIGIDSNCIVDSSEEDRGGDVKISPSDKAAAAQAEAEQLEWLKAELEKAAYGSRSNRAKSQRAKPKSKISAQSQVSGFQESGGRNTDVRRKKVARHIFVFTHCPIILKDIDEDNNYFNFPKKKRAEYIALFKEYGVDVVFAGHTHMEYDTTAEGIRFVTAGPVGSPLGRGYSGYELVTVSKDSVRCTFLSTR